MLGTLAGARRTLRMAFFERVGRWSVIALAACVLLSLGAPAATRAALSGESDGGSPESAPGQPAASPGGFQGFASPSEVPEWAKNKPIEFYVPPGATADLGKSTSGIGRRRIEWRRNSRDDRGLVRIASCGDPRIRKGRRQDALQRRSRPGG